MFILNRKKVFFRILIRLPQNTNSPPPLGNYDFKGERWTRLRTMHGQISMLVTAMEKTTMQMMQAVILIYMSHLSFKQRELAINMSQHNVWCIDGSIQIAHTTVNAAVTGHLRVTTLRQASYILHQHLQDRFGRVTETTRQTSGIQQLIRPEIV